MSGGGNKNKKNPIDCVYLDGVQAIYWNSAELEAYIQDTTAVLKKASDMLHALQEAQHGAAAQAAKWLQHLPLFAGLNPIAGSVIEPSNEINNSPIPIQQQRNGISAAAPFKFGDVQTRVATGLQHRHALLSQGLTTVHALLDTAARTMAANITIPEWQQYESAVRDVLKKGATEAIAAAVGNLAEVLTAENASHHPAWDLGPLLTTTNSSQVTDHNAAALTSHSSNTGSSTGNQNHVQHQHQQPFMLQLDLDVDPLKGLTWTPALQNQPPATLTARGERGAPGTARSMRRVEELVESWVVSFHALHAGFVSQLNNGSAVTEATQAGDLQQVHQALNARLVSCEAVWGQFERYSTLWQQSASEAAAAVLVPGAPFAQTLQRFEGAMQNLKALQQEIQV